MNQLRVIQQFLTLCIVLTSVACTSGRNAPKPQDAYSKLSDLDLRADDDQQKRYFLMGPHFDVPPQGAGYGLVIILPGGLGNAEVHGFVKALYWSTIPKGFLAAQLVAPRWSEGQEIVWPTQTVTTADMRFTTSEFIESVVADVKVRVPVDPDRIYLLSWSSSGPASYGSVLTSPTIRGAFIAASIFKPSLFPPLAGAKGKRFYLIHSRDDTLIPYSMAEQAVSTLTEAGAEVFLEAYEGGHSAWAVRPGQWVFPGVRWLDSPNH